MVMGPAQFSEVRDGRQSPAASAIFRGVARLLEAHGLRVARGDYNIAQIHLADAIEALVERSRRSLSEDRSAR